MKQRPTSAPLLSAASSSLRRRRARGEDTTEEDIQRFESFAHDIKRRAQASGAASKESPPSSHLGGEADDSETYGTTVQFPVEPQPWVRPTVSSQPDTADPHLHRLSSQALRRRAVRTSYPPEADQFEAFAMQGECEQRHRLVYAFREKDVLPPDETAMLDSKDAVRDLLAKYEDRRTFKSNAETDLGAWVATLPGQAQDFGNLVNARGYELELEQMEEQQMGSVIRNETDKLDAAMHHLYDFGGKMFDDLHDAVDRQSVQLEKEERLRQKRRPRDAATTTELIVPIAADDLTGAELSQLVPYGCGVIPEDSLLHQVISREALRIELGDVSFRSQSVNGGTALSASTASAPLSPRTGGNAQSVVVREELDALRNVASRLAHQREFEAQRFRERLSALQAENAQLQRMVADNRRDVQRTLQEESGVEVSWEDVNNGRSAAQFLADALPMVTEAIMAKLSREVEFSVHHKVRTAAQVEIDEAKAATAQAKRQLAELNKQFRVAIEDKESELKFHVEQQRKLSADLDRARQELSQKTGLWTQASRELGEWRRKALDLETRLRTLEDQLESVNVQISVSRSEAEERVLLAQRTADQQIRKGAEAVSHETKRLQQEVEEGVQQRLRVEAELAAAKHNSQQKIASLEHALQEARTVAIDTRVVERFVDGVVSSLFGNLLHVSKTLRQSALKDNLLSLRTSCAEACTTTVKSVKTCLVEQRSFFLLLSHDARESVSRSEKMCGWELDELVQANWNATDPTEVALHAAKKDVVALRDALQVAKDAAARQASLTAAAEAKLTTQATAATALVQRLSAAVHSLCSDGSLSPDLRSWSPSPPDVLADIAEEPWWSSALQASLAVYRHIKEYVLQREEEHRRQLHRVVDPAHSPGSLSNQSAEPANATPGISLSPASSIASLESGAFAASFAERIHAVLEQLAPTPWDGSAPLSSQSVVLGMAVPLKDVLHTFVQALTSSLVRALESSTGSLQATANCVDCVRGAAERVSVAWLRCGRGLGAIGLVKQSFQRRVTKLQDSVSLLSDACERVFITAKVDAIRQAAGATSALTMERATTAKRVLVARCDRVLSTLENDLRHSLRTVELLMAHHVSALVAAIAEVPAQLAPVWERCRIEANNETAEQMRVSSPERNRLQAGSETRACQTEHEDPSRTDMIPDRLGISSPLPLRATEPLDQPTTFAQTVSPRALDAVACCASQTDDTPKQHQSTETDSLSNGATLAEERSAFPPADARAPAVLTVVRATAPASTQTVSSGAEGGGVCPSTVIHVVESIAPPPQRRVVSSVQCQTEDASEDVAPSRPGSATRVGSPSSAVSLSALSAETPSAEASRSAIATQESLRRGSPLESSCVNFDKSPYCEPATEATVSPQQSSADGQSTKFAKAKGLVRPTSATAIAVSGHRVALTRPYSALRRAEPASAVSKLSVSSTACMTDMDLLLPYIITLSRAVDLNAALPSSAAPPAEVIAPVTNPPSRSPPVSLVITTRQKQAHSTPKHPQQRW